MRLPPLNALRAFEAAARHGGFIGAAEELHVTRGAISRHVKLLEEHLGTALFTRQAQGVRLTAAGRRFLPVLTQAFATIAREAGQVAADAAELKVICPPATSIRWLLPRLDDFRRRHPEIRLRLTTDFYGDMGFVAGEFDIGFSLDAWPGRTRDIMVAPLFEVRLTPALAPSLLAAHGPILGPDDLTRFPILHENARHDDWSDWLAAHPVAGLDPRQGDAFTNLDLATKAAVLGAGVVMADRVLCADEIAAGALVLPLAELECRSRFGGVCLVGSRAGWDEPKVRAFRDWALGQAGQPI